MRLANVYIYQHIFLGLSISPIIRYTVGIGYDNVSKQLVDGGATPLLFLCFHEFFSEQTFNHNN